MKPIFRFFGRHIPTVTPLNPESAFNVDGLADQGEGGIFNPFSGRDSSICTPGHDTQAKTIRTDPAEVTDEVVS